ncbi:hypothetical protein L207DRAFT_569178 [Hyaloscypha variabilis F]|uniref:Transcription factor domain-containing protein n=1 Tax=Hyaloscypha variabilis (strain UAMH 11265 / GT02V1 / F) TaxID=1149755 RepID=A0A2J6RF06_HYAVF|nr:hypothetical protein L207DRAFT_569178 [Hyaloscypha variabilis F]
MFRDESENVVLAHRFPKNPSKQKPSSLGSTTPNHPVPTSVAPIASLSSTRRTAIPVLSINPCSSSEEQAVCYFFQNYILGEDSVASGSFQFLPDILLDNEINEVLSDSLTAVGLVGLAHFYHDPSLMFTAVYKYNSAMRKLSLQLRDIGKAKSDQYFMAIMLLGLYEVGVYSCSSSRVVVDSDHLNTCHNQMAMETWTKHIDGAAALMQMRGKQRLQTPLGCHLFKQLRAQVVIKCIHRQTSVPPFISEWSHASDSKTTQQDFHTTLSLLVIRYANLRASMSSSKDYSDPERIISTAYALECDFASWVKSVPLEYIYQTINLSERVDEVYSDHYHVYSRIRVATTWNHYRCARLLTNEIILDQLSYLYETNPTSPLLTTQPYYSEQQTPESNATLRHLCEDICASVPYYLGFPCNTGQAQSHNYPKHCTPILSSGLYSQLVGAR